MSNAAAASAMPPSSGEISAATMKLLVDTASQRVLFAEAGKDVVDFLFSVLAMLVGVVASLLRAEDSAAAADALGSVVNVYASAEKMDDAYMLGAEARDALVVNHSLPVGPSLRLVPATAPPPGWHEPAYPSYYHSDPYTSMAPYGCSTSTAYWTGPPPPGIGAGPHAHYPPPPEVAQHQPADRRSVGLQLQPPTAHAACGFDGLLPPSLYRCHACHALGSTMGSEGFVQDVATYTVMDDLTVTHASKMSTVALLGRMGVKDLGALEEKTVTIGRKECLEILKVSLRSKTVLTDVFVAKTKKRARTAGDNDDEDAAYEDATE